MPLRALKAGFAVMISLTSASLMSAPQDQGAWVRHDTNFQFMGFTTTYSCDGLADKLKILLIAAGARADSKALAGACASSSGRPDRFASARLMFYTLAPGVDADHAGAPVGGEWRTVALADRSPRDLRLGDCELVEQFRDKVLPMFTTRNVEAGMTCVPNQLSGSVIRLKFEVFAGVLAPSKK